MTTIRRRAISAGSWSLATQVISQAIRFGSNMVMTRLLVPEMFGVMTIATTVSIILWMLSDIGLRQNIVQSMRGNDPVFLNTTWTVQIVRGFILFAAALFVAALAYFTQMASLWPANSTYATPVLPIVLAITGFSSVITGFQSTNVAVAYRSFQQKRLLVLELTSQLIALIVMISLGYLYHSIWSLVSASLCSAAVSTILSHLILEGPKNRFCWDRHSLTELSTFGRWIFLSSCVGVLAAHGDRILLGGGISAASFGLYSIAILIIGAMQTVFDRIMSSAVLPSFSEISRDNPGRFREFYYRIGLPIDITLMLACGFFFTSGSLLVELLYDNRYSNSGHMLEILALSTFMWRYKVSEQAYLAIGLSRYIAYLNLIRCFALFTIVPAMLALGGLKLAIMGIAMHSFSALPFYLMFNSRLGILDIKKECLPLLALPIGWLIGRIFTSMF